MPRLTAALPAFVLLILSALPVAATDDAVRPWPGIDPAMRAGWNFTPAFEPGGRVAWFHRWADPLNVDAPQEVYRVERVDGEWQTPEVVPVAPGQLLDWPMVTPDGQRLILSVAERIGKREFDFDLYATDLPVADPVKLERLKGEDLNRAKTPANARLGVFANEFGARMTDDGVLWFWSEREEATGDRDIFFARPTGDGFAKPEEFALNTPDVESNLWISPDGQTIIFNSDRPGSQGGDLWFATRDGADNDNWGKPCRLPEPINSAFEEGAANRDPLTGRLLFTSNRPVDGARGYQVFETEWPKLLCP